MCYQAGNRLETIGLGQSNCLSVFGGGIEHLRLDLRNSVAQKRLQERQIAAEAENVLEVELRTPDEDRNSEADVLGRLHVVGAHGQLEAMLDGVRVLRRHGRRERPIAGGGPAGRRQLGERHQWNGKLRLLCSGNRRRQHP